MMNFVSLDEAKTASGLRLVLTAGIPSPWSEVAKGFFDTKGIDYRAVRLKPGDAETRAWTGHHNAPVAVFNNEPPRAGWQEILMLAERIAPEPALLPRDVPGRVEVLGWAHEILGENGLVWCARLTLIHLGLTTAGQRGFSVRASEYLAAKYGYESSTVDRVHTRVLDILRAFRRRIEGGHSYLCGDVLTAADLCVVAALGVIVPLPEDLCPMLPAFRRAYDTGDEAFQAEVSADVLAYRDRVYQQHLVLPIAF